MVNSKHVSALVDTGAVFSLVDEGTVHHLRLKTESLTTERTPRLQLADGKPLSVIGMTTMTICIDQVCFQHDFYVVHHLGPRIIMGIDVLTAAGCKLDLGAQVLSFFDGQATAVLTTQVRQCQVAYIAHTCTCPSNTEMEVDVMVPRRWRRDGALLVQPLQIGRQPPVAFTINKPRD